MRISIFFIFSLPSLVLCLTLTTELKLLEASGLIAQFVGIHIGIHRGQGAGGGRGQQQVGCIHNGAPPLATALPARRGSCFYLVHSSTYQQPSHNYTTTTIHDAHKYVNRMYRIETTDNVHYNMQYLPHVRTVRVRSMRNVRNMENMEH